MQTKVQEHVLLMHHLLAYLYYVIQLPLAPGQKIQLLLDYCQRRDKIPYLLAHLEQARPDQFLQRFGSSWTKASTGTSFEQSQGNRTTASPESSVVGVCDANGRIVGTGFIASERLILTCAHVVEAAGSGSGKSTVVRFHHNGEAREAHVSAEYWRPSNGDDIAVLQFVGDLPSGIAPLALGSAEGSEGHEFRSFGYPSVGNIRGLWATGEIKGLVRDEAGRTMLQLASPELAQGISGGPVLDQRRHQVIGMVTAVYHPTVTTKHRDTGFATPVETLWKTCPELIRD